MLSRTPDQPETILDRIIEERIIEDRIIEERPGVARGLIERYLNHEAARFAAEHLGSLVFEATAEAVVMQLNLPGSRRSATLSCSR